MGYPEFSEFQFAFGLTRELDAGAGPFRAVGTPWFPSQPKEKHLGFDLGWRQHDGRLWPLFLQFKRSKELSDKRAKKEHWDFYHGPFFRFKIRTTSHRNELNQHERLYILGQHFPDTYYAAPEFIAWEDYYRFARNYTINTHSVFLKCGTAPTPIDDDTHYICHRPVDSYGVFFSEEPDTQRVSAVRGYEDMFARMLDAGPPSESYEGLRDQFSAARGAFVDDLGLDISHEEYTAQEPSLWLGLQQQFFYETTGTMLYFLTDHPQSRH